MTNESHDNELIKAYKASNSNYSREPGSVPINKGQILTFIDGGKGESWTEYEWQSGVRKGKRQVFLTKEGYEVPFRQILRRGNGLGLTGTRVEMLEQFAARINGNYAVVVVDTFKQESSYYDGKDVYLVFMTPEEIAETGGAQTTEDTTKRNEIAKLLNKAQNLLKEL